jgi:hypothetical protein
VEQKKEANSRNPVPKHVSEKNTLPILFPGAGFFVKLIFFMSFRSVPSFESDSSVNLGMPQNDHFLPRNKGNHSEPISRNFFGTKFRCLPYSHVQRVWKRDTVQEVFLLPILKHVGGGAKVDLYG